MSKQRHKSVWDALESDPYTAHRLKIQSALMIGITERVKSWDVTQSEAAQRLGVTQPRLNDMLNGKFDKFRLDSLVKMALTSGLDVQVTVNNPDDQARKKTVRRPARKVVRKKTKTTVTGVKKESKVRNAGRRTKKTTSRNAQSAA